jgi:hypothetical protein
MANDASAIISNAIATAQDMREGAATAIDDALGRLSQYREPRTSDIPYMQIWSNFNLGDAPEFHGQHYTPPNKDFGPRPELASNPERDYGEKPGLTAQQPLFIEPLRPSEMRPFGYTPPSLNGLTIPPAPAALSNLNFAPPKLADIAVPPAPSVHLPEFAAVAPDTDIEAPTDFEARFAANYASMSVSMRNSLDAAVDAHLSKINPEYHNQMATLEAKLSKYMAGGTALPIEVEQAIYNRARDKTNAEYLKSRDQIMKEGASRGFTIPGGAQYSALAQSRQAAADNNARAAMDIAIKQAEMEQQNIQFAVTQSANLRGVVLQAASSFLSSLVQINGQAVEYARDVLSAAIALYDTMVKIATARIEIYKAEAQVYEIRLRAVLAVYDVYQAEIKAIEAQVNVDQARVAAFTAQMNGYGALANAYKAVIDGVVAQAQVEKLKVDIFGAEVSSYSAEVGAKQAEWQGFIAQVQGESAKQQAYGEEVRAYAAEVEGYKTSVSAWAEEVRAVAAKNEGALKVYEAAVKAYIAQVQGASASAKAEVESFATTLQGYVAKANAEEARAKADIQAAAANQSALLAVRDANNKTLLATSSAYNSYMTNAASVAVNASNVYASMANSAMAGISSLGAVVETITG